MKHGYRSKRFETPATKNTHYCVCFSSRKGTFLTFFNHLITSMMEYFALCASLFLKNALISKRKSVTFCNGNKS